MTNQKMSIEDYFASIPRAKALKIMGNVLQGLAKAPDSYRWHGLAFASNHSTHQLYEKKFDAAFSETVREDLHTPLGQAPSWKDDQFRWHFHIATWLAQFALLHGFDLVECGVFKGATSFCLANYHQLQNKKSRLYLVDTYQGIPESSLCSEEMGQLSKNQRLYCGDYSGIVERVFARFPNVTVVKGIVPEVLDQVDAGTIGYLHIDMNAVEPEIAAANYFWDKLAVGAMILLDDYGWASHKLQREAFDEFAKAKGTFVMALPTGQGVIQKLA